MPVFGYPFIFNEVSSETYEASLVFLEEDYTKRPSGGNRQFTTDYVPGNSRAILLDVGQTEPLSFNIEIVFNNPVDAHTLATVKNWLSSPMKFCKLRICAEGFKDFYYNCYINLSNDLIYNGGYRGVTGTVVCDAPWAWENERTDTFQVGASGNPVMNKFINYSHDGSPMRPILSFTTKTSVASGAFLAVEDVVEDENGSIIYDRTSIFVSNSSVSYIQRNGMQVTYAPVKNTPTFSTSEKITLDNQSAIITSSKGIKYRANNFNKVFLKIPQGVNKLYISGTSIAQVSITYNNAKRFGGGWY